CANRWLLFAYW
nr:immunoglobulin heavy chain junction region [Mus musculus]